MNKIKMTILVLSLISFFSTLSSCNGQNNSKTPEERIEIGVTVSQLDETIWVIYQYNTNNLLFGMAEGGIYRFNGKSFEKQF